MDKRIVTLTLTNTCNLKCTYCYENEKSSKAMSFDVAKKVIDFEFSLDDPNGIEFDLFGGEPFVKFDLIKEIDKYLTENYANRQWILFATTNGTLVHGEIQEWLRARPYFYCGLSLDGNKSMHDINRSNSFDQIDIDFFKELYPLQGVKMTVSAQTLPHLFDGVKYLHDLGFQVNCNLAYGIDWSDKTNKAVIERELMKLIDFYLENPQINPCKMLDFNIDSIGYCYDNMPTEVRKWCGAGTKMHTFDVDGNQYPCQFFMPLSIGEEKAKSIKSISFLENIPIELLDDKCQKCPYVLACPTCYGANYCCGDSIYAKDDDYCILTKIQLEATAYFKALRWKKGQIALPKEEEVQLLRAIKAVQDIIKARKASQE